MAAAYTHHLSGGAVEVRSAGSEPADQVNAAVRDAMLEEGIDLSAERPKILTTEAVPASDVVIAMGCGDTCPTLPGKRYEDWVLEDPAGQGNVAIRPIRDAIKQRVAALLDDVGASPAEVESSANARASGARPPTRGGASRLSCTPPGVGEVALARIPLPHGPTGPDPAARGI